MRRHRIKIITIVIAVAIWLLSLAIFFAFPSSVIAITFGTPHQFNDSGSATILSTKIDSSHIAIIYNNGAERMVVIGSVSGNSISYGTAVEIADTITPYAIATLDSSHVIIGYEAETGAGTAVIGTISGTSISLGTPVVFNDDVGTGAINIAAIDSTHAAIVYSDSFQHGNVIVANISDTTITYGTSVSIFSSGSGGAFVSAIDSTHVFITYYIADSGDAQGQVGTISGTEISLGSATTFAAQSVSGNTKVDSTHAHVLYRDGDNNVASIVAVISGASVSFGSPTLLDNSWLRIAVTAGGLNQVVIVYRDGADINHGKVALGTVSGSSISFGSPDSFDSDDSASVRAVSVASLTSARVVISYIRNVNVTAAAVVATIGDNSEPTFTSISHTSGYLNETEVVTFTSVASDPDEGDTVTLYICKADDFTGSDCGAGGEWGHSSASNSNPSATYTIQSSDADGSHTYYANIVDSNAEESTDNARSDAFLTDQAAPTVNAGSDQETRNVFTTSASATDSTAGIATYAWTKTSGVGNITFGSASSLNTTITADVSTTYVIRLTATDNAGNSNYDEFTLVRPSITGGGGSISFIHTIAVSTDGNGEISPAGVVNVDNGSNATFTVTPNTDFEVADVLVDGISVGRLSAYTFEKVQAGHSIHAIFTPKDTSINLPPEPGSSNNDNGDGVGNVEPVPTPELVAPLFIRYLALGDEGDDVLWLQRLLFEKSLLLVQPNGYYGLNTLEAVRKFQISQGIKAVGNIGPMTQKALNVLQLQKAIQILQEQLKLL